MTNKEAIKKAALIHNPSNVTFKNYKTYFLLIAPNHSYHSAAFDLAFKVAEYNSIKYRNVNNNPYTIKFY